MVCISLGQLVASAELMNSSVSPTVNASLHTQFYGGICCGNMTKLLNSWPMSVLCLQIALLAPLELVYGTSILTEEHTQPVSGIRISCCNLLCSNTVRQLASALLYEAK